MIKLSRPELSLCVCLQIWNQSGAGRCASVYSLQYFLINQSYFSVVLGVAAVISPYQRRCTGEILRNSPDIGELQPCLFSSFNQKLSTKCKLYAFLVSLLHFVCNTSWPVLSFTLFFLVYLVESSLVFDDDDYQSSLQELPPQDSVLMVCFHRQKIICIKHTTHQYLQGES